MKKPTARAAIPPVVATKRRIDLDHVLIDLDGLPALRTQGAETVPMTARYVMQSSLVAPRPPMAAPLDKDQSYERYQLTMKLHSSEPVTLSAEEIVTTKDAVCAAYGPLIYGQVCDLIDPKG